MEQYSLLDTISILESKFTLFEDPVKLFAFFERLNNLSCTTTDRLSCTAAKLAENRWKNRYRNIIPFDDTRVRLFGCRDGDYINANFIEVSDVKSRRYIFTQGPLPETVSHFWLMVMEQRSPAIIMLNTLIEEGRIKCFPYYPDTEQSMHFEDINLTITCFSVEYFGYYSLKKFKIINNLTSEIHECLHFHFTDWPDFGVPSSPGAMLNILWDIRSSGVFDNPNCPPIVHCSAGVGRSGAFALIDLALVLIETTSFDLLDLLLKLRQCRMGIIQTAQQLRFSCCAILAGAKALANSPPESWSHIRFEIPEENAKEGKSLSIDDSDDELFHDENAQVFCMSKSGQDANQSSELPLNNDAFSEQSSLFSSPEASDEEFNQLFGDVAPNQDPELIIRSRSSCQPQQNLPVTAAVEFIQRPTDSQFDRSNNAMPTATPGVSSPYNLFSGPLERTTSDVSERELGETYISAALTALESRRRARLARQATTLAKLKEIRKRMLANDQARRRWLPSGVVALLQRCFVASGLVNSRLQAACVGLSLVCLFSAIAVGYWYTSS